MSGRKRKKPSFVATVLILAATAALLFGLVRIWPSLAPPGGPGPATPQLGAPATQAPQRTEEITAEERRELDRILRKRPPTP